MRPVGWPDEAPTCAAPGIASTKHGPRAPSAARSRPRFRRRRELRLPAACRTPTSTSKEEPVARSRSGTRGRRGPRKPPRRDGGFNGAGVQTLDPRERGAIELPGTITVKELAELLGVNPADIIRELIKRGIFATINQLVDRDTASLVAGELGYEVAETIAVPSSNGTDSEETEAGE